MAAQAVHDSTSGLIHHLLILLWLLGPHFLDMLFQVNALPFGQRVRIGPVLQTRKQAYQYKQGKRYIFHYSYHNKYTILKHLLPAVICMSAEPVFINSRPLNTSVIMALQAVTHIISVRFMTINTVHVA